jgi:hypothetical protein
VEISASNANCSIVLNHGSRRATHGDFTEWLFSPCWVNESAVSPFSLDRSLCYGRGFGLRHGSHGRGATPDLLRPLHRNQAPRQAESAPRRPEATERRVKTITALHRCRAKNVSGQALSGNAIKDATLATGGGGLQINARCRRTGPSGRASSLRRRMRGECRRSNQDHGFRCRTTA